MPLTLALALAECSTFDRDNPLDPKSGEFVGDLETVIVGTWNMETRSENQMYVFKSYGSVDLVDYSSPSGGDVNRNASYPDTRISRFSGIYILGGTFRGSSSQVRLPTSREKRIPPCHRPVRSRKSGLPAPV